MKKILLISIFFVACQNNNQEKSKLLNNNIYQLHYFKDDRTDLCFAFAWAENYDKDMVMALGSNSYDSGPILTNVPCSDKIEVLLESSPKYFTYIK